jgi:hypothetical protein
MVDDLSRPVINASNPALTETYVFFALHTNLIKYTFPSMHASVMMSSSYLIPESRLFGQKHRQPPHPPAATQTPARLRCALGLGPGMIVHSLSLEEDGVVGVPPEVRHWVPAVAPTGQDLQPPGALPIRTRFTC